MPQDGLGISNNDIEQIGGKDYNEIDEILYKLCYELYNIKEENYTKDAVMKIKERYENAYFKRNHPVRLNRLMYDDNMES
jgi:NH3-dependent NAD+ synthetase